MKFDPDHDPDRDHDPDQGTAKTPAPAPAGGALTSLTALGKALNQVDLSGVLGRTGKPLMLFKSREGGIWQFGQRRTEPEEGSRWVQDPRTYQWGWVCFGDGGKRLGEILVPITQPKPDIATLPDHGHPWSEQWAVQMKCLDGTDAGVEVIFKTNTDGGTRALAGQVDRVRTRLNSGQHNGYVAPVSRLENSSYPHSQYGRIYDPVFTDAGWMSLDGSPEPESEPTPPSPASPSPSAAAAEQPRRRRVA